MKKVYRYKFLREGLKSENGDCTWKKNEWKKHIGELSMCSSGFHCSKGAYHAFSYIQGEILAKVEVKGKHLAETDKECWFDMRIVKAWKWQKKDSVALAIFSAELVIRNYEKEYPKDRRPREAIEAAKRYLKNPTKKNQEAAWSAGSAAWSAGSAAEAARSAAGSAAWSARSAWSAAGSAGSAAEAARSAARSALIKKIASWFESHIKELEEV